MVVVGGLFDEYHVDHEYNVTLNRSADRRVPIEHLRPDVHGIAAAGLGALLFDEAITLQMLAGSLVLFASILIVSISKKATHRIDIQ